jgi:urease accessory protein
MFRKTAARCALCAVIVLIAPAAALAHPGFAPHSGLESGFLHPLTGVDHLLAVITVGIFAARVGRRGLWSLPVAFLMLMAVGGALGAAGVKLPFVEMMIALSVVALGLAAAIPRQWPVAAATLFVRTVPSCQVVSPRLRMSWGSCSQQPSCCWQGLRWEQGYCA